MVVAAIVGPVTAPVNEPGIRAVAVLDDRLRRGMYAFIRAARRPVTRDEAAACVGISRKLAAFHLDKLVAAGLLRARYAALGARKVGRAPKVYEPTDCDVTVTIPPRQHDLLAELLLEAVASAARDETAEQAAIRVAGERGRELGRQERTQHRAGRLGAERALTIAHGVLARHGFEPEWESPTCVKLRNCPFHALVARAPALVCGMTLALVEALLEGLSAASVRAMLVPTRGECCVELRSRSA